VAESSSDAVRVPVNRAEAEVRDRGSRFLSRAGPASSEADARRCRDEQRTEFHGATHHVWAYLGSEGLERWDDDGEPAGTGGRPILAAIKSAGLSNTVVVVTRWFGGTKLGTGGLARAYGAAAGEALDRVRSVELRAGSVVRIRYDWPDTGPVATALEASGARRLTERFESGPEVEVVTLATGAAALVDAIRDATSGRAQCRIEDHAVWVRKEG
jgi:putative IMPACT (imprinted ancient) family translation regulator